MTHWPIKIVAIEGCPEDRMFLISPLSEAGELERGRRVAAGENDTEVLAELLVREKKAAVIRL